MSTIPTGNLEQCPYSTDIFTLHQSMESCSASTGVLKSIFGQPIDVLTGTASEGASVHSLMTLFLGNFNTLGLALILAIFSYVVFHGFISTVNEGKFGGRDMGHWSYALRAILPGAMLVPVKGGFCAMQFVLMYFILVGVNLANYVWQHSVDDINIGYTPTTPTAISNALAQDVSVDFVIDSVFNIEANTAHNFVNETLPVDKESLWDSPYASTAESQLKAACGKLNGGSDDKLCVSVVNDMVKYDTAEELAPMGGASVNKETDAPFHMIANQINGGNPSVTLGGSYHFAAQPKPATGSIMAELNTGISPVVTTLSSHESDTAKTSSPFNCNNDDCSFNGVIDNLEATLSSVSKKDDKNFSLKTVVQGTGLTCAATCRSTLGSPADKTTPSYALISTATTQKECTAASSVTTPTIWTKQCFVPSTVEQGVTTSSPVKAEVIADSWWYAPRSYIQLDNTMATNINNLANEVKQLVINPDSLVKYDKGTSTPNVTYDVNLEYRTFTHNGGESLNYQTNMNVADLKGSFNFGGAIIPDQNNNRALNAIPWDKLINWYGIYRKTGETATQFLAQILGSSYRPKSLSFSAGPTPQGDTATDFPTDFKNELYNIPTRYQNPLKILILMNMLKNSNGQQLSDQEFYNDITHIIDVLRFNHVYANASSASGQTGVGSAGETTPVNNWIDDVFNNLMGSDQPFQGSGATPGIFEQIYALGNSNVSTLGQVMTASFNTMANAQKVGLEMINVVTESLTNTYSTIDGQLSSDEKYDRNATYASTAAILTTAAAATYFGAGGQLAGVEATIGQTLIQMKMADQMLSIGKELAWMPIAILVLTSMFTAGISFAVILPLTPFFLFWAGEIAWILAVIEAMVAAPLLTIGLTTPGGHQHFGHAMPGLKMLLGVVFRPVLMVLGLLAGMVLTYVLIRFSSQGFQLVSQQILSYSASISATAPDGSTMQTMGQTPLSEGIIACILLFTFCSFMMLAFTKCFSLIYQIPEKVMQWIGGMADKAGQQELQQMTQGMSQQAQQGAQAGGQSTEKGVGAKQQHANAQGAINNGMMGGAAKTAPQKDKQGGGGDAEDLAV